MEADLLLRSYLKCLKLPTIAANYRKFAQEASNTNQPYERYLLALTEAEAHTREANAERKRIARARFPSLKTLDSFEFATIPSLNKQAVLELTKGQYLEARENVILVGPTGTGKTHISIALGIAACRQGKRVRFTTAAGLINELIEAQAQLRLSKLEATLLKLDLLILDEVGFIPFSKTGAELLFGVLTERYERGSVLVTTNLDFASWTEVFGDGRLTGALLDRLTHRCHIIEFQGDSYRFKESLRRKQKART
ncbi:MAG: IS21-like element helper ATPase IstB [Dehalococcoidia bacterium]